MKYQLRDRMANILIALLLPFFVGFRAIKEERTTLGLYVTFLSFMAWPIIFLAALLGRTALRAASDLYDIVVVVTAKRWWKRLL